MFYTTSITLFLFTEYLQDISGIERTLKDGNKDNGKAPDKRIFTKASDYWKM